MSTYILLFKLNIVYIEFTLNAASCFINFTN